VPSIKKFNFRNAVQKACFNFLLLFSVTTDHNSRLFSQYSEDTIYMKSSESRYLHKESIFCIFHLPHINNSRERIKVVHALGKKAFNFRNTVQKPCFNFLHLFSAITDDNSRLLVRILSLMLTPITPSYGYYRQLVS
jgi:hypothetical protein